MSDDLSIYSKTSVECTSFPVYMDSMVQFYDMYIELILILTFPFIHVQRWILICTQILKAFSHDYFCNSFFCGIFPIVVCSLSLGREGTTSAM